MRKFIIILAMTVLLKARYTSVPGTDPEYAQGAIERNELAHREVEQFVWVFEAEGTPEEWERRLKILKTLCVARNCLIRR